MIDETLSPLDGRYTRETAPLRSYFSERAYTRLRLQVEIDYLIAYSHSTHLVRQLSEKALFAHYGQKLVANEDRMRADPSAHGEIVAEGAQTILRAAGTPAADEELKALTRGKVLTERECEEWVDGLAVEDNIRERLGALTPYPYVGLAEHLVNEALADE